MISRDSIIENIMCCPVCHAGLEITENKKSALCRGARKHCFDFSSDGYLSLSGQGGGDSKIAVAARRSFLSQGFYDSVAQDVCETVKKYVGENSIIVDAGCGEGYYTSRLAGFCGGVAGFDLSKFGCAAASKLAKRQDISNICYATASVFELPVFSDSVDAVVNIFAPCAEVEYKRILKDGGYLFVVGAGKDHLMGLKKLIYDETYENGERSDLPQNMKLVDTVISYHTVTVDGNDNLNALFSMTPYYWRTSEKDKQKLVGVDTLETQIQFEIRIYQK